nr:translation initiation factor eIF-2B subunit delta [Leptinotarsa decemlineata]
MEKVNSAKMEGGQDGLTKKESRTLKVQNKQSQDIKSINKKELLSNSVKECSVMKIKNNLKQNKPISSKEEDNKDQSSLTQQLSEKELRKLEWEKRLAEEKLKGGVKVNKETLSKAELKAKRREQQEAQRLLKAASKTDETKTVKQITAENSQESVVKKPKKVIRKSPSEKVTHSHRIQLVQHLYDENSSKHNNILPSGIHPAFIMLGVQYSKKKILGSNARCLAMLATMKHLVNDLEVPAKLEFCRYLETVLQSCTNYLQSCRSLAVSMTNALRHFKLTLTQIDTNLRDNDKRAILLNVIDTYINDDIEKAGDAISMRVGEKIINGDVILTYGCSSLVRKILLEAHKNGKKFEVIVVDGRPLLEGREMLRRLVISGIKCTYVLINSISYIMNKVTKVILGAHALLTNGYVMSRMGTAQVAMVARAYNKSVLVCCETYKFSERVQTDSIVINELGDHESLSLPLEETGDSKVDHRTKLPALNLIYDVTPPDLVTAVVTELAILPCTSVPVVLRINLPK